MPELELQIWSKTKALFWSPGHHCLLLLGNCCWRFIWNRKNIMENAIYAVLRLYAHTPTYYFLNNDDLSIVTFICNVQCELLWKTQRKGIWNKITITWHKVLILTHLQDARSPQTEHRKASHNQMAGCLNEECFNMRVIEIPQYLIGFITVIKGGFASEVKMYLDGSCPCAPETSFIRCPCVQISILFLSFNQVLLAQETS